MINRRWLTVGVITIVGLMIVTFLMPRRPLVLAIRESGIHLTKENIGSTWWIGHNLSDKTSNAYGIPAAEIPAFQRALEATGFRIPFGRINARSGSFGVTYVHYVKENRLLPFLPKQHVWISDYTDGTHRVHFDPALW